MGLTNEREERSLLTLPHQEGLLISRCEVIQTPCHQCPPWHGHVPTAPCLLSCFVQQAAGLLDHWWADVWGVWTSSREASGFVQHVNCQRKESDAVLGRDFWTQLPSFPTCALCWDSYFPAKKTSLGEESETRKLNQGLAQLGVPFLGPWVFLTVMDQAFLAVAVQKLVSPLTPPSQGQHWGAYLPVPRQHVKEHSDCFCEIKIQVWLKQR